VIEELVFSLKAATMPEIATMTVREIIFWVERANKWNDRQKEAMRQ
jgi:hypothetical protein